MRLKQQAVKKEAVRSCAGRVQWLPAGLRERVAAGERVVYRGAFGRAERRVLEKRRPIAVSEWSERHRVVTQSSRPGPWRNRTTPYLAGVMDAMAHPAVRTAILCKAPQIGGSECVHNLVGWGIDRQPGPVLYVYPDRLTAAENSRDRIVPMIEQSQRLSGYLTGVDDDKTSLRVKLLHMVIYLGWAGSPIRMGNRPIKTIIFDETDKYPEADKREAGPIALGEKRVITYQHDYKIIKISTPTTEQGPIWRAMEREAQVVFDYHVRCPECGALQRMVFPRIRWAEGERDPEAVLAGLSAWYECEGCQAGWDDLARDRAVARGEWRSRAQGAERMAQGAERMAQSGTAEEGVELGEYLERRRPAKVGFHLPSWVSRFRSLSAVAASFLRTEAGRNKTALRDFRNAECAEPWVSYEIERSEDQVLALCDERPRGAAPVDEDGARVAGLTAAVDTQDDGFYYEVRAWGYGPDPESWGVREGFALDFAGLEEIMIRDAYADAAGREYRVQVILIDAMGHRTDEVYNWARQNRGLVWPLKGQRAQAMPVRVSKIDTYPATNKQIPGGLQLLLVDTTFFKNKLSRKLEIAYGDPGCWYLHAETTVEWARQMTVEYVDEKGWWQCPEGRANHAWDVAVYGLAAHEFRGLRYWRPGGGVQDRRPGEAAPGRAAIEKRPAGSWLRPKQEWFTRER